MSCGLGASSMGVPRVEVSQDYLAQGYLDKPGGCSPGTRWRPRRRAGPRCGARGSCRSSCGPGSPARSPGSRTTRGPRRPSPHSPRAGRCPRCAGDPPPGLRVEGLASATGASSEPNRATQSSAPAPSLARPPPATPPPPPPRSTPGKRGGWWGGWDGRGAVPSVSQVPKLSAGQVRVSVLLLPNCRPWGSGRGARHVKRNRCSCRAPPWVTFTGSHGVQGVLRRTSGQPSGLQVLNSLGTGAGAVS